jgi:hypothetical protein
MALEKEIDAYAKALPTLKDQAGKFVLIRGDDVVGTFSSYEDALREGYAKFKLEPFLVRQIQIIEKVQVISRYDDAASQLRL